MSTRLELRGDGRRRTFAKTRGALGRKASKIFTCFAEADSWDMFYVHAAFAFVRVGGEGGVSVEPVAGGWHLGKELVNAAARLGRWRGRSGDVEGDRKTFLVEHVDIRRGWRCTGRGKIFISRRRRYTGRQTSFLTVFFDKYFRGIIDGKDHVPLVARFETDSDADSFRA